MNENTTVSLETLRAAFTLLLEHLESEVGTGVHLDHDYFWSVPHDQIYDIDRHPTELTIGQLSESLANLQSMLADPEGVITYGLVWLGDLLKAIGHQVVR